MSFEVLARIFFRDDMHEHLALTSHRTYAHATLVYAHADLFFLGPWCRRGGSFLAFQTADISTLETILFWCSIERPLDLVLSADAS